MFGVKIRLVRCAVYTCWCYVEFPCSVLLVWRAEVTFIYGAWSPYFSTFWSVEDCCSTSWWGKGDSVKVMWAFKKMYAESWGWVHDLQRILNVSCACIIKLHHSIDGILPSHVLKPVIVWILKVVIVWYAALTQWLCGSTNCSFIFPPSMYFWLPLKICYLWF